MSLTTIFDIAGSGMTAQSERLNIVASNLSNQDSIAVDGAETYRAREPVFQAVLNNTDGFGESGSVSSVMVAGIVESDAPLRREYMPGHPLADKEGYVDMPNVNPMEEMANMISASRSYQDNAQVLQTAKNLMLRTLNSMND